MEFHSSPLDTDLKFLRKIQLSIIRRLSLEERALMTFKLCSEVRQISEAGVRSRHPEYNDEMVKMAVIQLVLGKSLFKKVYPDTQVQP